MPKVCVTKDGYCGSCPMDRLWCAQRFAPDGYTMGQIHKDQEDQVPDWCPLVEYQFTEESNDDGADTYITNRDYIIAALRGEIDDGGATEESVAAYDIECPYTSGIGHPCDGLDYPWDKLRVCGRCKLDWLEKEYR